jgi:membrane associated rhomboid family serine protease
MASMLVWWGGEPVAQALTWRAGETLSQPWTWWTTAWVHIHTPHLVANQLALGALAALAWVFRPDRAATLAWALAWPLSTVALLAWPQVGYSAGLSGVLHAAVAVAGTTLCMQRRMVGLRYWGGGLLSGLVFKLVLEQAWHQPVVWDDAANLSVVRAVHLSGAISGVVLAVVFRLMSRLVRAWLRRLRAQPLVADV